MKNDDQLEKFSLVPERDDSYNFGSFLFPCISESYAGRLPKAEKC